MNAFWGKNNITGGARRSRFIGLVQISFSKTSLGYKEQDHFIQTDGEHGLGHGSQKSKKPVFTWDASLSVSHLTHTLTTEQHSC